MMMLGTWLRMKLEKLTAGTAEAVAVRNHFIRNGLERLQPGTNVFWSVINLELNITTSFQKVASKMQ